MDKCNVILNGERYIEGIDSSLFTICADGGYEHIRDRFTPNIYIGDRDSVSNKSISAIEFIELNPEKDLTDGEAAIDVAIERGYRYINLYGIDGGRLDHILTNLKLAVYGKKRGVEVVGIAKKYDIYYFTDRFHIEGSKGKTLSLVPFGIDVHIMSMKGLKYEVNDFTLDALSSRGMSNVIVSDSAEITIDKGASFVFVLRS